MKYGFLLTDCNGNDYRTIANSLAAAIKKTVSDNDLKEVDVVSAKRCNPISIEGSHCNVTH